jgi:hypothetical protein
LLLRSQKLETRFRHVERYPFKKKYVSVFQLRATPLGAFRAAFRVGPSLRVREIVYSNQRHGVGPGILFQSRQPKQQALTDPAFPVAPLAFNFRRSAFTVRRSGFAVVSFPEILKTESDPKILAP